MQLLIIRLCIASIIDRLGNKLSLYALVDRVIGEALLAGHMSHAIDSCDQFRKAGVPKTISGQRSRRLTFRQDDEADTMFHIHSVDGNAMLVSSTRDLGNV